MQVDDSDASYTLSCDSMDGLAYKDQRPSGMYTPPALHGPPRRERTDFLDTTLIERSASDLLGGTNSGSEKASGPWERPERSVHLDRSLSLDDREAGAQDGANSKSRSLPAAPSPAY